MEKTLYISDLDGTLLQPDGSLSAESAAGLNALMEEGALFSVASARTEATAKKILKDLKLSFPAVLMNGVLVYDLKKEQYLKVEEMEKPALSALVDAMKRQGISAFLYALEDGRLHAYYESLESPAMREFYEDRAHIYEKPFHQVPSLCDVLDRQIVYFTVRSQAERLRPLAEEIGRIPGLDCAFYSDTYSPGIWFLEAFSEKASKRNAVLYLKEHYGLDRVVCFGDNLNDLPMFSVSDACYAVANAVPETKEAATAVIGANTENGVMRQVRRLWEARG